MKFDAFVKRLILQGFIILALFVASGVYLLFFVKQQPPPPVPPPSVFWEGKTFLSEQGYIVTENYLPLRALARKPNVRLFRNSTDRQAMDVVGTMEPWEPYYVYSFAINDGRMQIGKSGADDKLWVSYDDCFCWPTRECLSIEGPTPVYKNIDALKGNNPIEPGYTYKFEDHFHKRTGLDDANRKFARQESYFWCVLRPEGDASGYQKCWIEFKGDSSAASFRIRTSREEWARYLTDLYNLQNEYRNQARSEDVKQDLLKLGVSFLAFNSKEPSKSIGQTYTQAKGILKPTGGIQGLLRNDLEYDKFRDKFVKLAEFDSTTDNWDSDTAFPLVDILP